MPERRKTTPEAIPRLGASLRNDRWGRMIGEAKPILKAEASPRFLVSGDENETTGANKSKRAGRKVGGTDE